MHKKNISFSTYGQSADIGTMQIKRLLPNRYADAVGPFIFLDHIIPVLHDENEKRTEAGTGAHPHRGIATLTYLIHGEAEHFDSAGNHAKVHSGGIQWMKSGKGIIHDETIHPDSKTTNLLTHGFQFWINLPSRIKAEAPAYIAIQADKVPEKNLDSEGSWLKIIVGEYEKLQSVIPNYSTQFLYHIHLKEGKQFKLATPENIEYACFLPQHELLINDTLCKAGEFVEFERGTGEITCINNSTNAIDVLLFGGAHYEEPIVAEGPFVMNSHAEIATAYRDFMAGKYGEINYGNLQK